MMGGKSGKIKDEIIKGISGQLSINHIVKELYNNMVLDKRTDGSQFYKLKEPIQWQTDVIWKAHLDRMPDDDIYKRIYEILSTIVNCESIEEMEDRIIEMSPDPYTKQLTEWLNSDIKNVYYLTNAIENYEPDDGFSLLSLAQKIYIDEIGHALIRAIQEELEKRG